MDTCSPTKSSSAVTPMHVDGLYVMETPQESLPLAQSNNSADETLPVVIHHQAIEYNDIKQETPYAPGFLSTSPRGHVDNERIPGLLFQNEGHSNQGLSQVSTSSTNLVVMDDVFFTPTPDHNPLSTLSDDEGPVKSNGNTMHNQYDSTISALPGIPGHSPRRPAVHFASGRTSQTVHRRGIKKSPSKTDSPQTAVEYVLGPPTTKDLLNSWGAITTQYRDPHYSNPEDVPENGRVIGGLYFHLEGGDGFGPLSEWKQETSLDQEFTELLDTEDDTSFIEADHITGWEYASVPPSRRETLRWLRRSAQQEEMEKRRRARRSQASLTHAEGFFTNSVTDRRTYTSRLVCATVSTSCRPIVTGIHFHVHLIHGIGW